MLYSLIHSFRNEVLWDIWKTKFRPIVKKHVFEADLGYIPDEPGDQRTTVAISWSFLTFNNYFPENLIDSSALLTLPFCGQKRKQDGYDLEMI